MKGFSEGGIRISVDSGSYKGCNNVTVMVLGNVDSIDISGYIFLGTDKCNYFDN